MSSGDSTRKPQPDYRQAEIDKYVDLYDGPRQKKSGKFVQYGSCPQWRKELLKKYYTRVLDEGGTRVLDVGVGWGESLKIAHAVGIGYHGVEVVPKLCGHPSITLVDGAHSLPFPDRSFDAISCVDVMEHVAEQDVSLVFSEIARVASESLIGICLRESEWKDHVLHITLKDELWWMQRMIEAFQHVYLFPYEGNPQADQYLVARVVS